MSYEVREITDKKLWEDFSLNTHPNTFLQSWAWGEFNQALGRKIWRLGVFTEDRVVGICLLALHQTRLGNYLYSPRGPLLSWDNWQVFDNLFSKIKEIGKEQNAIFIKLDPALPAEIKISDPFKKRGFTPAVTFVQVEDAWLLPLDKPEDQILMGMRKTTRYLIRAEEKQWVRIDTSDRLADVKTFVDLLYQTASRKGFVNHPKDYYIKQFEILAKEGIEKIFIAKKGSETLSMAMIAFYGDMGNYLHAASNPKSKESVGYALQWEAIKEAKRRGCKYYNFWGVVKDKNFRPGHPWYGFSLFKRGFGGIKYTYLRAQDFPLNNRYYFYRFAEHTRRLLRRVRYGYWED
jgi:lipid II:glycine glycyltransferase (peptidoglycan interpeptide bridge formation enzyme)